MIDTIERAKRYSDKMPAAVAGQGGDLATFKVALAAHQGFGLDEPGTMAVLNHYNCRCLPPWPPQKLLEKARSALRTPSRRPKGYLLDRHGSGWDPVPLRGSPSTPTLAATRKPRPWPGLRIGTKAEIAAVAAQLGLRFEGVALAHDNGVLRFGTNRGHAAWFVTDSAAMVCQARRVDGKPWNLRGSSAKSDTIVRKAGLGRHLVGLPLAADYRAVLLLEGASDLLAGFAFVLGLAPGDGDRSFVWDVCPVAMLGAGNRFTEAEVHRLAGKRVFICYDDDGGPPERNTGQREARKRAAELAAFGASPYQVRLPAGAGDFREAILEGLGRPVFEQISPVIAKRGSAR